MISLHEMSQGINQGSYLPVITKKWNDPKPAEMTRNWLKPSETSAFHLETSQNEPFLHTAG